MKYEADKRKYSEGSATPLDEIERLLSFAEDVDHRIHSLYREISRARFQLVVAGSIAYSVIAGAFAAAMLSRMVVPWNYLIIAGGCVVGITSMLYAYSRIQLRSEARSDLEVELRIIGDIIQMLSSLLEGASEYMGVVTHAMIEMRLKRIQFTVDRRSRWP